MDSVVVHNLNPPGTFSVTNNGNDIRLLRMVLVEKQEGGAWTATDADVRLIATCEETETGPTRLLKRGETLVVKSWNGWSCDGQCPRPCRANIYLGPGTFRFVVRSENGTKRFEGPPFELGQERR
jgi:hypothetical protein